eukprot:scaffold4587_cov182-Amphora_coffeaeformis.AAC.10
MSDGGLIDLTLDDERDTNRKDGGGHKGVDENNRHEEPSLEIPYAAYLPIGVDVTDDVVILDSDSENEQNIAEADVQAHFREQMQASRHQVRQQGKFAHAKALEAAARKRKRKRTAEAAERKRIKAEQEAERKRKAAEEKERKRIRAEEARERNRIEKQRKKEELERKRKAEAELLRKNPPTGVNFIIIDTDPESDLTASRKSPAKKMETRKFFPIPPKRQNLKLKEQIKQQQSSSAAKARARSSSSGSDTSFQADKSSTAPETRKRTPQPYAGTGACRVEYFRPTVPFRSDRDYNYRWSREEVAAEQDRLFREAAERMRQQSSHAPSAQPLHVDLYGPTFDRVIANIHKRYPIHWTWKNPYSCLGLPPGALLVDAKSQYRILVRAYHPDKSKEQGTSSKFHAVVLAFKKIQQQATAN